MTHRRFTMQGDQDEPESQSTYCAVRVFRVDTDTPEFVKLLTNEYGGCFTHHVKNRSEYCCGDACRLPGHGVQRNWKGYAPALRLLRGAKPVWAPICLEISENLELDLRSVFARGQTWQLFRRLLGNKKSPIEGRLEKDPPPDNLPKPFDIMPALRALYHRDVIDLRHPSPIPARVYVQEVDLPLPEVLTPKDGDDQAIVPPGFSFSEEFKKKSQQRAAESRNGRAGKT